MPQHDAAHGAVAVQPRTVRRWRRHLADERLEAALYRELASRREGEESEILLALADAEARHAAHWADLLGERAADCGRPRLRSVVLVWLARRFGSVFVLALAQRAETRSPYAGDADATPAMAADEQIHAEVVRGLAERGRARISGSFRAAVFGANDGLVSNLALVVGVAAGGVDTTVILLTGLAGLLAGALSMAAGEYISVRSQRELLEASTPGVGHLAAYPHLDVDANELALVYRARGMPADQASEHARQQLAGVAGVDDQVVGEPLDEVVGTGARAAAASFVFFASGALVPVLPFIVGLEGAPALISAFLLVSGALMLTGATVGMLSGGPPLRRALRQLAIGAGATAVTFLLGQLFGATVA